MCSQQWQHTRAETHLVHCQDGECYRQGRGRLLQPRERNKRRRTSFSWLQVFVHSYKVSEDLLGQVNRGLSLWACFHFIILFIRKKTQTWVILRILYTKNTFSYYEFTCICDSPWLTCLREIALFLALLLIVPLFVTLLCLKHQWFSTTVPQQTGVP